MSATGTGRVGIGVNRDRLFANVVVGCAAGTLGGASETLGCAHVGPVESLLFILSGADLARALKLAERYKSLFPLFAQTSCSNVSIVAMTYPSYSSTTSMYSVGTVPRHINKTS